jgi:hypothetical protein
MLLAGCADEPYDSGYRSGSRAAIAWWVASDGTRHFDHWIDRQTGRPCQWLDAGDGVERCLDDAAASGRALVGDGNLRAIVALGSDGSRAPLREGLDLVTGVRCQVDTDELGGGRCGPTELVDEVRGAGRLRARVLADATGDFTSPPLGLHDDDLDAPCSFAERDGTSVCMPWIIGDPTRVYTDAGCTESVLGIVMFGRTGAVVHPDGTRVYRLGEPVVNAKVIDPTNGDCEYLINSWSALPIVETLGPPDLVSAVLTTDP